MSLVTAVNGLSQVYSTWSLYKAIIAPPLIAPTVNVATGPYRPAQWQTLTLKTNFTDASNTVWYFDAILKEEHHSQLRITEHPVQTGANITDHAYMMPARLTLEIGMSDAMDSMIPGQWPTMDKSIWAYQQLVSWQQTRTVLTITTNLNTYSNMVIEQIMTPRDNKTTQSVKSTVTLRQIMVGVVGTVAPSARANTTTQTQAAPMAPVPIPEGPLPSALSVLENGAGIP